jgi:hypothetical protein
MLFTLGTDSQGYMAMESMMITPHPEKYSRVSTKPGESWWPMWYYLESMGLVNLAATRYSLFLLAGFPMSRALGAIFQLCETIQATLQDAECGHFVNNALPMPSTYVHWHNHICNCQKSKLLIPVDVGNLWKLFTQLKLSNKQLHLCHLHLHSISHTTYAINRIHQSHYPVVEHDILGHHHSWNLLQGKENQEKLDRENNLGCNVNKHRQEGNIQSTECDMHQIAKGENNLLALKPS